MKRPCYWFAIWRPNHWSRPMVFAFPSAWQRRVFVDADPGHIFPIAAEMIRRQEEYGTERLAVYDGRRLPYLSLIWRY